MRIGGLLDVDPDEAVERAEPYRANDPESKPYSYPWYDTYVTNSSPTTLCDGDLLAPLLLNAAPDLTGYRTLSCWRPSLNERLRVLSDQVPLSDGPLPPDDPRQELVGALYQPVDDAGPGWHISGNIPPKCCIGNGPMSSPVRRSNPFRLPEWSGCSNPRGPAATMG